MGIFKLTDYLQYLTLYLTVTMGKNYNPVDAHSKSAGSSEGDQTM